MRLFPLVIKSTNVFIISPTGIVNHEFLRVWAGFVIRTLNRNRNMTNFKGRLQKGEPSMFRFLSFPAFLGVMFIPFIESLANGQNPPMILNDQKPENATRVQLEVRCDHKDCLYQKGENVAFSVQMLENGIALSGKAIAILVAADGKAPEKFSITSGAMPYSFTRSLDIPGFILVTARANDNDGNDISDRWGAGLDVANIQPSYPEPADFDQYWQKQRTELAKVPMQEISRITVPVTVKQYEGKVEVFDVAVSCAGPNPLTGYLVKPLKAAAKSIPAILMFQGAGVASPAIPYHNGRTLAFAVNLHGIKQGMPSEYYTKLNNGELSGFYHRDINDPQKIYLRNVVIRVMRALEYIKSQPEWDGKILVAYGGSFGGAQSIMAAALDPQVSLCVALIPALCDNTGIYKGRSQGWAHLARRLPDGKPDEAVLNTSRYYDLVNFARRIKAETVVEVGLVDEVCPPAGCYAMFNSIPKSVKKIILPMPGKAHGVSSDAGVESSRKAGAALSKIVDQYLP